MEAGDAGNTGARKRTNDPHSRTATTTAVVARCFNGRLRLLLPGREHSAVDVVAAGVEPSAAVVAAEHSAVEPSAAIVAADALLLLSPPPPLPRDC